MDQIKDMGMSTVLVGHSERRGEFGLPTPAESNQLMATKLQYALDHGLRCVFCIGEPLPVRERGIDAVLAECVSQLQDIVPILRDLEDKERVVIAYEPVWAIGTGVTASPQQAQETHRAIRDWIARAVDRETADGPVRLLRLLRRRGHAGADGPHGLVRDDDSLLVLQIPQDRHDVLELRHALGEPLPVRERGIDAVLAECVSQLRTSCRS